MPWTKARLRALERHQVAFAHDIWKDVRGLPVAGAPSNEPRVAAMDTAKGIAGPTSKLPFWKMRGGRLMGVCGYTSLLVVFGSRHLNWD
jgi:hypothetical protein